MINFSTQMDCPWETIKMVSIVSVFGHISSLESQKNADHPVFTKMELIPEDFKTPALVAGQVPVPPKPMPVAPPPAAVAPKPATPPPPAP